MTENANTKSAIITIAGRPNVGKSTLTNALIGEKIAIVTNKPQTTRNRIRVIINRGDTQIVLMDTPGFHRARTRLGEYMVRTVRESIADVDAVALMVEPIATPGEQERQLIEFIKKSRSPSILVINKIDSVPKSELLAVITAYTTLHDFEAVVPVSAKNGDGLDSLMTEFERFAVPGPKYFPEDMVTDQPEKQVCAEIIREKLLLCLDKEIPHGVAVVVTKFSERIETEIIDLEATVYCEKESHKGMIIGKNGEMLKRIGQLARADIERFMGAKVYLQTWVKVKDNWRDSEPLMRNFGYSDS
jgi:GTP-binding protein Era